MASVEQCKTRLREKFRTKQDVIDFGRDWGGGHHSGNWSESEFIEKNIERFVDQAYRANKLDLFAIKIGLPSEAEEARRNMISTSRRSWMAICISLAARIVSVLVAILK